jgi:hypothetical protein
MLPSSVTPFKIAVTTIRDTVEAQMIQCYNNRTTTYFVPEKRMTYLVHE